MMGDSQRFLDLINNLNWQEGLSREAVDLVESTLATSHTRGLDTTTSTADSTSSSGTEHGGLITVSMAKHASEAAACMCSFAIAIVDYQYLFEPYRMARERADKLRKDMAGIVHVYIHASRTSTQKAFNGKSDGYWLAFYTAMFEH